MGGPCLAHKPWPENRLRQVGTGSSVFPLIKWRGGADTFLQEPRWGGRWGLLSVPCALLPCFTLGAASHQLGVELCRFCAKHAVLSLSLPLWVLLLMCSSAFSSFSRNQKKCLSVVPVLGDFWRCRVMPLCLRVLYCMAWNGPTFSWGKAFPGPPTKISLPLV